MTITVFENCTIFDGISAELLDNHYIVVEDGVIREVASGNTTIPHAHAFDVRGKFVMPGLIDAHFHAYAAKANINAVDTMPQALRSAHAIKNLQQALQNGFTTVRDAAGGDVGLRLAIDQGLFNGPRFYFSGRAISQTGGHGDMRAPDHDPLCPCQYCGVFAVVADGPDEVRRAVREELRRGATQIKIFVSGGIISPSDPVWMNQMTDDEIVAAVEEAETRRTYVMAHAHTAEAVLRCVRNGVRSIEHATILTDEAAKTVSASDAYVVPTLATVQLLVEYGEALGLSDIAISKAKEVGESARLSLEMLASAKAKIGFGTDLLGDLMARQSFEFILRGEVMKPLDILRSATSVNASLLCEDGNLGVIAPGAYADFLVLEGNPLTDISVIADQRKLLLVVKDGSLVRNELF